MELESIVTALENLPGHTETEPERIRVRTREREVVRRRLARAGTIERTDPPRHRPNHRAVQRPARRSAELRPAGSIAGRTSLPARPLARGHRRDQLPPVLRHQRPGGDPRRGPGRLRGRSRADLPVPREGLGHRAAHRSPRRPLRPGRILREPSSSATARSSRHKRAHPATNRRPRRSRNGSLYLVVEKILARDENLPPGWPVCGTTGYDFLNLLNGLFVDRRGAYALLGALRAVHRPTLLVCRRALREQARRSSTPPMASELNVLAGQLDRISEQHRWSRDFTRTALRRAPARGDRLLSGLPHLYPPRDRGSERRGSAPHSRGDPRSRNAATPT